MDIKIVPAYEKREEISELFSEYVNMLIENDESFKRYLDIQNYDEEIEHLESKYGIPINVNIKMYSFDHLRMYNFDHINIIIDKDMVF